MASPKLTDPIQHYILQKEVGSDPLLLVDGNVVVENFKRFKEALPDTLNYYAVKANPHPEILKKLVELGGYFDCASITEITAVLAAGAAPDHISYGNTIKSDHDIETAYKLGIRLYATDSVNDVEAIAQYAPGSHVYCRFICRGEGFAKPYSDKFGCDEPMAIRVLTAARDKGLNARGVSFHVGTQKLDTGAWPAALEITARIFQEMDKQGVTMDLVNLGGAFPTNYVTDKPIPEIEDYAEVIKTALDRYFPDRKITTMIEPGRGLVGNAGVLIGKVINISQCAEGETPRVFLNIGTYHGLRETKPDAFVPFVTTLSSPAETADYHLFGPTCDATDFIGEGHTFNLPKDLARGHIVLVHASGAYTMGYSTTFNGFPAPTCKVIWE